MVGKKKLQLKGNAIPHGLVPLERLFNKDDIASKKIALEKDEQVEDCNIGSKEEPRRLGCPKESPHDTDKGI